MTRLDYHFSNGTNVSLYGGVSESYTGALSGSITQISVSKTGFGSISIYGYTNVAGSGGGSISKIVWNVNGLQFEENGSMSASIWSSGGYYYASHSGTITSGTLASDSLTLQASGLSVDVNSNVGSGTEFLALILSGNDTVTGSGSSVTLFGYAGADTLQGTSGNDILMGGAGNDVLNGGLGSDTSYYSGNRSNYIITLTSNGYSVASITDGEGTDTLSNIEYLQFADQIASLISTAPTVASPISDISVSEDATFTYTLSSNAFYDANSDILTYSAARGDGATLPAWLTFAAASRTFSGTPQNSDVGAYEIAVTATDTGGSAVSDSFWITVTNSNDAPAFFTAIADQGATEDQHFVFQIAGTSIVDVDVGDTLAYTTTQSNGMALPAWLVFNDTTAIFSGTPVNGDIGNIDITVTARDSSNATASDTFRLSVTGANDVPTLANAVADQIAEQEQTFAFTLPSNTFMDEDGDALSYAAALTDGTTFPAWLTFDPVSLAFSGTPAEDSERQFSVRITASDGNGASVSDVFWILIPNSGTDSDDTLPGSNVDDVLFGRGGNDTIDGGSGIDTAIFTGRLDDYTVSLEADGSLLMQGADGTDRVTGVERILLDDESLTVLEILPAVQLDTVQHYAKVQSYFLGGLGREATISEAFHFTNVLQENQSRVWWNSDLTALAGTDSLMGYLMAQNEYSTLTNGVGNATLVIDVFRRLTGQTAPQDLVDHYVARLDAGTLLTHGLVNKMLGDMHLSPRGDGTLGGVSGFQDNRYFLDGAAIRGYIDRLDAIDGINIENLDSNGNLVELVGVN